jgi:hypothetical protein
MSSGESKWFDFDITSIQDKIRQSVDEVNNNQFILKQHDNFYHSGVSTC